MTCIKVWLNLQIINLFKDLLCDNLTLRYT